MKNKYINENEFFALAIVITAIFVCLVIVILFLNNHLQKQIDALPHKYCHNEPQYEERCNIQPVIKAVPCPCQEWGCLAYCYQVTNSTKSQCYNQSIGIKEVCEIR